MYPSNMWGLLGLTQCLDKAGDPEVGTSCLDLDRLLLLNSENRKHVSSLST